MEGTDTSGPVVVVTASTLQEADVLCAAIRSAGIEAMVANEHSSSTLSHLNIAINPNGVEVIVPGRYAEAAREALAASWTGQEHPRSDEEGEAHEKPLPDDLARKAYRSGFLAWLFPPVAFITLYWFIRACAAARARPPVHPRRYRWHMTVALLLGIVLAAVIAATAVWGGIALVLGLLSASS